MQIATIGVDLAKHVFQLHGVSSAGAVVLRKKLRRAHVIEFFAKLSPCLVGMEACGTAHHWAREIRTLGHEVRLMPAIDIYATAAMHTQADNGLVPRPGPPDGSVRRRRG